jgi:hypothetical protein
MAAEPPTLADQIQSVEWAEELVTMLRKTRGDEDAVTLLDEVRISARLQRSLAAAAETLRTLEFGSEVAR